MRARTGWAVGLFLVWVGVLANGGEQKATETHDVGVKARPETDAPLVPAAADSTFVEFLKANGRIPKTPAEWEHDLKKLGGVVRHSQFAFSTAPTGTSLLRRRIVFTVDPTERTSALMPMRHTMAVAGILQPDGSLAPIEFISPRNTRLVSEPEFGVLENGVPYHADTKVCYSCHRNHAFIFPPESTGDPEVPPWANTLINQHNVIGLYARLTQRDPKKYGPIHAEMVKRLPVQHSEGGLQEYIDKQSLDGLRLHDDAIEVCNSLAAANTMIQMQQWLKAIPAAEDRSELLRTVLQDTLVMRAKENGLISYPSGPEFTAENNLLLKMGDLLNKAEKKFWHHAEDLPLRLPMAVIPPRLPKDESELLKLDEEMKLDSEATLRRIVPFLPSSPKGFLFGPNLESHSAMYHDQLSKEDDQKLYAVMKDAIQKTAKTAEEREAITFNALESAVKSPSLRPYLESGAIPDRHALLAGVGEGLKTYFAQHHHLVDDRFDHLVEMAPEGPVSVELRPEAAVVTGGKCAGCHQAKTAAKSLRFSLDPTDPKAREAAFASLSPIAARHFIQRYWVRAVLERSMPPDGQGELTEAEIQDLRSFLTKKAELLGLRLRE